MKRAPNGGWGSHDQGPNLGQQAERRTKQPTTPNDRPMPRPPRRKPLSAAGFRKLSLAEKLRHIATRDDLDRGEIQALQQAAEEIEEVDRLKSLLDRIFKR
jgi:hypothetical protein